MRLWLRATRGLAPLAAGLAAASVAWPLEASAQTSVGTSRYPDVRALPPTNLGLGTRLIGGVQHYLMAFKPRIYNRGPGPLEIHRVRHEPASGPADLTQRVYEDPTGFRDERLTTVGFRSPFLFELPQVARYEVWTQRAFARAVAKDFSRDAPQYVTSDVAHCLADEEQIDQNAIIIPFYLCSGAVMGVSVGWSNDEAAFDPHIVDFGTSPIPDGPYVLRAIADPSNLVWESAGKADPLRESPVANQALTRFEVRNGSLVWQDP